MLRTNSPVTWILIYDGDEFEVARITRQDGGRFVHLRSLTSSKRFRFGCLDGSMSVGDILKAAVKAGQKQGRSVHLLRRSQGFRGITETLVL